MGWFKRLFSRHRSNSKKEFSLSTELIKCSTPDHELSLSPGDMEFIHIPGGSFMMGDVFGEAVNDCDRPVHKVELDSFYLGKYPVTFRQYDSFCFATGRKKPADKGWGRGDRPVINVTWKDAKAFCDWLSEKTGEDIRLPTEAEWEYAARDCGKKIRYSGTSEEKELGEYAWYKENSDGRTHPVGEKKPNGLGLYDMSGNVAEWCADLFDFHYYSRSPLSNPKGPNQAEQPEWQNMNVQRGGCYDFGASGCTCTLRDYGQPVQGMEWRGFRCAKTSKGK